MNTQEKIYIIYGTYKGKTEEIDETDNKQDAIYLVNEYRLAYGNQWNVFFRRKW